MKIIDLYDNLLYLLNPKSDSEPPQSRYITLEGKLAVAKEDLRKLTREYTKRKDID